MLVRRILPFLSAALALAVATPGVGAEEIQIEDAVRNALERNAELASLAADVSGVRAMEENLRLVATAYQAGKIGLFELRVLRRDALDARRERIPAQEDFASAEAQLLRAHGQEGPSR